MEKDAGLGMTRVFFIRSAERRNIRQAADRRCTRLPQVNNSTSEQQMQATDGTVLAK
jgi:hypothetical protein